MLFGKVQMEFTSLAITVLCIVLLFAAVWLMGVTFKWILERLFRGFGRLLTAALSVFPRFRQNRSREPMVQPSPSMTPARRWRNGDVLRSANGELVVTCELGDEWRMSAYEHRFLLNRPIAGVDRLDTASGSAELSEDDRFLVVHDYFEVVILDRGEDRGVRLRSPFAGTIVTTMIGDRQIIVHLARRVDNTKIEESYRINVTDEDGFLIPNDWPGEVETLADPHRVRTPSRGPSER
jgi:hypothetical protein